MAKCFRYFNSLYSNSNKSKNRKNNFESWNIGPNIRENVVKVIELINKISNHLDHKIKTKTKKPNIKKKNFTSKQQKIKKN